MDNGNCRHVQSPAMGHKTTGRGLYIGDCISSVRTFMNVMIAVVELGIWLKFAYIS